MLYADSPVRVLCLHGKYENAGSFCFRTAFLDDFEGGPEDREVSWEYCNGAHLVQQPDQYEWWKLPPGERSFTAKQYEGTFQYIPYSMLFRIDEELPHKREIARFTPKCSHNY